MAALVPSPFSAGASWINGVPNFWRHRNGLVRLTEARDGARNRWSRRSSRWWNDGRRHIGRHPGHENETRIAVDPSVSLTVNRAPKLCLSYLLLGKVARRHCLVLQRDRHRHERPQSIIVLLRSERTSERSSGVEKVRLLRTTVS